MSLVQTITEVIAASRGRDVAAAYAAFKPTAADKDALAEVGKGVLHIFPPRPGACVVMSALYACGLQTKTSSPVYVAVGSLFVGTTRVFGSDAPINGEERFSRSDLSWDGHGWLVLGDHVADVSIFRTAYSPKSPPMLAKHVLQEFGKGRGLFICRIDDVEKSGLHYVPQYVLSESQVTGLARGAMALIDGLAERQPKN
jgi:hypothetical protein